MNKNLKPDERELVKLATFFKKESRRLIAEGKLAEEHSKVSETVDKFLEHLNFHADNRAVIIGQREQISKLVKDDAECPSCKKKDMLKFVSIDRNEKGWKSNRYKCRRCNIEFTWNRPNNPWDMISYIEEVITVLRLKTGEASISEEERAQLGQGMKNMEGNLASLKPVIEAHDADYNTFMEKEAEMERLVHEFKNSLMIERIKLDTWENRKPTDKK